MDYTLEDETFMRRAIELAQLAEQEGNLPVGAVITLQGEIVAEGRSAIWVPSSMQLATRRWKRFAPLPGPCGCRRER